MKRGCLLLNAAHAVEATLDYGTAVPLLFAVTTTYEYTYTHTYPGCVFGSVTPYYHTMRFTLSSSKHAVLSTPTPCCASPRLPLSTPV